MKGLCIPLTIVHVCLGIAGVSFPGGVKPLGPSLERVGRNIVASSRSGGAKLVEVDRRFIS